MSSARSGSRHRDRNGETDNQVHKESPSGRDSASQSQAESNSASATGSLSASTRSRAAHHRVHERPEKKGGPGRERTYSGSRTRGVGQGASDPLHRGGNDKRARNRGETLQLLDRQSQRAKSKGNMRIAMRARMSRKLTSEKEDVQRKVKRVDELTRVRVMLKNHIASLETEFAGKYGRHATSAEMRYYAADAYHDLQSTQIAIKKEERDINVLVEQSHNTTEILEALR